MESADGEYHALKVTGNLKYGVYGPRFGYSHLTDDEAHGTRCSFLGIVRKREYRRSHDRFYSAPRGIRNPYSGDIHDNPYSASKPDSYFSLSPEERHGVREEYHRTGRLSLVSDAENDMNQKSTHDYDEFLQSKKVLPLPRG